MYLYFMDVLFRICFSNYVTCSSHGQLQVWSRSECIDDQPSAVTNTVSRARSYPRHTLEKVIKTLEYLDMILSG